MDTYEVPQGRYTQPEINSSTNKQACENPFLLNITHPYFLFCPSRFIFSFSLSLLLVIVIIMNLGHAEAETEPGSRKPAGKKEEEGWGPTRLCDTPILPMNPRFNIYYFYLTPASESVPN